MLNLVCGLVKPFGGAVVALPSNYPVFVLTPANNISMIADTSELYLVTVDHDHMLVLMVGGYVPAVSSQVTVTL